MALNGLLCRKPLGRFAKQPKGLLALQASGAFTKRPQVARKSTLNLEMALQASDNWH